jgi:hypothetical protein
MGADYIGGPQAGQPAPTSGAAAGTDGSGIFASVKNRQL